MAICQTGCEDITLIGNPVVCEFEPRITRPSRLLFFNICDTLPDPLTDVSAPPLFADGTIVASMPLANFVFNEPTYEDRLIDDCSVALPFLVSREATFQDRVAVDAISVSPFTGAYFNYDFWQDKFEKQTQLGTMILYCNGDVKVARDENGTPLTSVMRLYLDYENPSNGGSRSIEFINGSLTWNGDPLALTNKPEFNTVEAGITV